MAGPPNALMRRGIPGGTSPLLRGSSMRSLLNRQSGWPLGPKPRISCNARVWADGVRELNQRTLNGLRESGAFLLGPELEDHRRILEFVFYDDIDPQALDTGLVHLHGNKLPKLWAHCRSRGYGVIADVHVHPGRYGQSVSDRANPVIPKAGHLAFIIPDFAQRQIVPGGIGIYEYLGNGEWADHTPEGLSFFLLDQQT